MIFNNMLLDLFIFLSQNSHYWFQISCYQEMSTPAQKRLLKDLQKILRKSEDEFMAQPVRENLLLWIANFSGAQGTIWEEGFFTLSLSFTEKYPNAPPKVKFLNKMFHPNIYNDGRICLDMLYNQWSPIYDVWAVLTAIKSLLADPNTQSPANIEASNIFRDDKSLYEYKVRDIVKKSLQFVVDQQQLIKEVNKQSKQKEEEPPKTQKALAKKGLVNSNLTEFNKMSRKGSVSSFFISSRSKFHPSDQSSQVVASSDRAEGQSIPISQDDGEESQDLHSQQEKELENNQSEQPPQVTPPNRSPVFYQSERPIIEIEKQSQLVNFDNPSFERYNQSKKQKNEALEQKQKDQAIKIEKKEASEGLIPKATEKQQEIEQKQQYIEKKEEFMPKKERRYRCQQVEEIQQDQIEELSKPRKPQDKGEEENAQEECSEAQMLDFSDQQDQD